MFLSSLISRPKSLAGFKFSGPRPIDARSSGLWPRDLAVILLFGATLYLTHLGDTRVLTRHEVFAAQPGREMLQYGGGRWIVPQLAGAPRTAKPPGMMWLIAASIFVFRSEAEWVARLPSVLALLSIATMIAMLTARWFGRRIGLLAGLLQLTFLYAFIQARLCEADMALAAAECGAMFCFALAVIDSPRLRDESWRPRMGFWLCIAAAFLLKGVIGLLFVALSLGTFAIVRRRGTAPVRDIRDARFLLYPPGIAICLVLVVAWPLLAIHLDPTIYHDWFSQMASAATGQLGSDPWYYYFLSVPEMLLPWTPIVAIGLWRGPSADADLYPNRPDDQWLRRHMSDARQRGAFLNVTAADDRRAFWRFLLCWCVPNLIFLTIGMRMKHYHYAIPAMLPLTIPAALGSAYYVRMSARWKAGRGWTAAVFLTCCLIGATVVLSLHGLSWETKRAAMIPLGLIALTGVVVLYLEHSALPNAVLAAWFLGVWAVAVSVQTFIMPLQDEFRQQADFARTVNSLTPPGKTVYMLGSDEEEQEAQYAYYLRFPMQRLQSPAELMERLAEHPEEPAYAVAPAAMAKDFPNAQVLTTYVGTRRGDIENDHMELVRIAP